MSIIDHNMNIISTHSKIIQKIEKTKEIIEYVGKLQTEDFSTLIERINAINDKYSMSIVNKLMDYYNNKPNSIQEYYQTITTENFIALINEILIILQRQLKPKISKKNLEQLHNKIKKIYAIDIEEEPQPGSYDICCGLKMIVVAELSHNCCQVCGRIETLTGVVFRDEQFYPQDGQKNKHGKFVPSRHFKLWLDCIQGIENVDIPDSVIEKLENVIKSLDIHKSELNYDVVRDLLKKNKLTQYNNNTVMILKRLGGVGPPVLCYEDVKDISLKFNKILEYYSVIFGVNGFNNLYYPYFIYKVIESLFKEGSDAYKLLNYIHMQQKKTKIKNDIKYKQICQMTLPEDGLVYKPTIVKKVH